LVIRMPRSASTTKPEATVFRGSSVSKGRTTSTFRETMDGATRSMVAAHSSAARARGAHSRTRARAAGGIAAFKRPRATRSSALPSSLE
jgi:hypothetical protein